MNSIASYFKSVSDIQTIRAKSPLLFQGEIPRHVYIVLDGVARAYGITDNGDERIVGLYGKGDVFPLSWALGEANSALFYYDTISDMRVLAVRRNEFEATLKGNPALASLLLSYLSHEYTALMLRTLGLVQSRTIDKLAYTFYFLSFRYGLERDGGEFVINFGLNQTMLASLIGQTREGTARNLKLLAEKGVVSYSGSNYTVNRPRLLALLGEDGFRDLAPNRS